MNVEGSGCGGEGLRAGDLNGLELWLAVHIGSV